jgi:hypothetical protein
MSGGGGLGAVVALRRNAEAGGGPGGGLGVVNLMVVILGLEVGVDMIRAVQ